MSIKQINMVIKEEDVARFVTVALQCFAERQQKNLSKCIEAANEGLKNKDRTVIFHALSSLLDTYNEAGNDLEHMTSLINSLEKSPPNAEVLEDLSDLEEDSLGVGSGSE
jgi:hypothetical protein